MNITVNVDEVTLDSIIREHSEGDSWTVGQEVARQALRRLTSEREGWDSVSEHVRRIQDEEIREAVRPLITEALTRPFRSTNTYGEPTGPETTLSAVIVAEAKKFLTAGADNFPYNGKQTHLQKLVAGEVATAFKTVIADEVKAARQLVAGQIGEQVAEAVAAGLRKR